VVYTDPVLLERILLNLAANAVRYTQAGGLLIGARVRGERVRIDVYDTGSGIAPHQQQSIFDPFYRAHPQGDGSNKGLGLGLAIVRRLAELLGLEVEVSSRLGSGSRFSVIVPRATTGAENAAREPTNIVPAMREGAVILLIDDDDDARVAAAELLVQWGYHVWSARSESEALACLDRAAAAPDAIISDYQLEHGSRGTDVIESLRTRAGRWIPGVLLTANAGAEPRDAAQAARVHLLKKPLRPAKLRAVLHHVLSSSAATESHDSPAALGSPGAQKLVGVEP
jgi:CheY-like chemotaxis protein